MVCPQSGPLRGPSLSPATGSSRTAAGGNAFGCRRLNCPLLAVAA
jgi:hypothetical protein